ncbi:hypothetical protein XF_0809 [Xylella fastidiosa 9a5c]|uniref:Uncharacterized protein n=1 Tax=Xylella fastidiosa (strain 9a5c) TaxID=160492 RepID=Q9PF69_XYLFA|nr:hypothetical protein XF_0809 [Xylella fastidiosa 9a5c]
MAEATQPDVASQNKIAKRRISYLICVELIHNSAHSTALWGNCDQPRRSYPYLGRCITD